MPDPETFDAFYARTVWNVTSQMRELAGDDGMADHAIREAYAKAYQQWYQVSGYRDSEGWVLATAKDAYERRRSEATGPGHSAAAEASDSGTWPGLFRPAAQPGQNGHPQGQQFADPDGTIAPPRRAGTGGDGTSAGALGADSYPAPGGAARDATAGNAMPGSAAPTRALEGGSPGGSGPGSGTDPRTRGLGFGRQSPDGFSPDGLSPGGLGRGGHGRNGAGSGGLSHLATPRNLIVAGVAVAALVIAGITYASFGGNKSPAQSASQGRSAKAAGKPKPQMLAAGRTGLRSAIPWTLVGPGWALAEFSTAQPQADGSASGSGRYTTYLVDPLGGKYVIATAPVSAAPQLMAWSGDGKTALFGPAPTSAAASAPAEYSLLSVQTGRFAPLPLPSGVSAVGFTRPDGFNILAVQHKNGRFWLERYNPAGALQRKLGSLPGKSGEAWPADGCGYGCALSSPGGLYAVWGYFGDQMQLLSNSGGLLRKLHVTDSGKRSSCVPLSWWGDNTILADCLVAGVPDDATRLWLVPENGTPPTPLTKASAAGNGRVVGAWQAGSSVYVTAVTSRQCPGVQAGFAGVSISPVSQAGSAGTISIPGTTNNVSTVVAAADRRLLVLAQTSCPGTFSLLWFNPAARSASPVIAAPSSKVGVVAAVPYGNGPTADSATQ